MMRGRRGAYGGGVDIRDFDWGIWRFVVFIRGCWLCRLRVLRLDSRKLDMSLSLLCDDMCSRRKSIEIYWGPFTVGIPEMNSMGNSLNRVADSCASQASIQRKSAK